jgi:hypothetical protein
LADVIGNLVDDDDDVSSTATSASGKEYSPDPNSVKVRSAERGGERERELVSGVTACDVRFFPNRPTAPA